jgi:hypothetical protein
MDTIVEYDRKNCHIRLITLDEARRRYDNRALRDLQQDGSAVVNKDIEIFFEGCYTPAILLTLET